MQLDAAIEEHQSQIKLVGIDTADSSHRPSQGPSGRPSSLIATEPHPGDSSIVTNTRDHFKADRGRHRSVTTLILSNRQVLSEGRIPGVVYPHLPQAPSLFRDIEDDRHRPFQRIPSPLRKPPYYTSPTGLVIRYPPAFAQHNKMPHAVSAQTGFQAVILCGPGVGLNTFTTVPSEYPKALIPIANRPMIWYTLDFCHRMGVTDITIITPQPAKEAIAAALAQNPYLTSLPSPSPTLVAPKGLEFTTPTAEILRLPEVQKAIETDFVLLPCDLVCDLAADTLLESYLLSMASLAGVNSNDESITRQPRQRENLFARGAEASGRRGGMSVWYNTIDRVESVAKEECDFMGTVSLETSQKAALHRFAGLPDGNLRKLVWTMPMSELIEEAEEDAAWKIRQSLLRRYGAVKCMTKYRDAHVYFLPRWIKDYARLNDGFESFSEDLIGTWAKSEWRKSSYRADHHVDKLFTSSESRQQRRRAADDDSRNPEPAQIEDDIDLLSLSSSQVSQHQPCASVNPALKKLQLASRVPTDPADSMISNATTDSNPTTPAGEPDPLLPHLPPILAYVLSSQSTAPLVRRIDTTALLLSTSLYLATLPAHDETSASHSPFSHPSKIHPTVSIPPKSTVSRSDTLIAPNTTLSPHTHIKSSCIASACTLGPNIRITNSLIMDGARIDENVVLSGCVIGKKAVLGKGCVLKDCEVQDGMVLRAGTEGKGEKYLIGGFEEGEDGEYGFEGEE